jgi:hypothetical protein
MKVTLNPPGSKHEAVLETDWFPLSIAPRITDGIEITAESDDGIFIWRGGRRCTIQQIMGTEEMLKGQAFGL